MLRDMSLFVEPVFRCSRMCEKCLSLPAIKKRLVVYKVSPFLKFVKSLWHIDTVPTRPFCWEGQQIFLQVHLDVGVI